MPTGFYLLWKDMLDVESNIPLTLKWVLIFSVPVCIIAGVLFHSVYPLIATVFFGVIWIYQCYKLNVLGDEHLRFVWNSINPGFLMGAGLVLLLNPVYYPLGIVLALLGMVPLTVAYMVYVDYMRPIMQARVLARLENDPRMRALFLRFYGRSDELIE